VVVDAGANIGAITVPLAKAVPEGYVVAVEAQSFLYNCLCGNLALNYLTNVQPMNRAAAATSGRWFFMPTLAYQEKGLNFGGFGAKPELGEDNGLVYNNSVSSICIDDMRLEKVKLIKIDVEGMEAEVLEGAKDTIRRCKPYVYLEMFDYCEHIVNFFREIGYNGIQHSPPLFNGENRAGKTENVFVNEHGPLTSVNVLFYETAKQEGLSAFDDPYLFGK